MGSPSFPGPQKHPNRTVVWAAPAPVAVARNERRGAEGRVELGFGFGNAFRAHKRVENPVTSGAILLPPKSAREFLPPRQSWLGS